MLFFARLIGWFFFTIATVNTASAIYRYSIEGNFVLRQDLFLAFIIALSFTVWQNLCFGKSS